MAFLEIADLEKKYKDFTLSLSLEAEEGEFISIIGPSGSGKSTLLSLIAGLEQPDNGRIMLGGNDITGKRIQERGIGMVFQDYSLFPSMNVAKNIQYGMKEKERKKRKELTSGLLSLVGLEGYEKRSVSTLSGGEAQRIALARALAAEPGMLLLDEPLSSLDAPMRKHLRSVIRSIHDSLGITMLYVTHDTEEAFAVSDTIAVMNGGRLSERRTPEDLYRRPKDLFTAFFTGEGTALPAHFAFENTDGSVFFRPENAVISEQPVNPHDYPSHVVFSGAEVLSAEFTGSDYLLGVEWQGYQILVRTTLKPRKKDVSIMILRAALMLLD